MSENLTELNEISFDGFLPPGVAYHSTSNDGQSYVWHLVRKVRSILVPNPGVSFQLRISPELSPKLPDVVRSMNSVLPKKRPHESSPLETVSRASKLHLSSWIPTGGDIHFSKDVIHNLDMKGMLIMEAKDLDEESYRRARVHAIASGAEKVLPMIALNRFIFVNSVETITRAKRILERLGYTADAFLFRFEPDIVLSLEEYDSELCSNFLDGYRKQSIDLLALE